MENTEDGRGGVEDPTGCRKSEHRGRAGGGEEQRPTQAEGKYRVLQEELLKVDIEG